MVKISKSDKNILRVLQKNCKIPNTTLAKKIDLAVPATKVNLRDVDDLRDFIFEKLTKAKFINKVETFLSTSSISNTNYNLINDDE